MFNQVKTQEFHDWLKSLSDQMKMHFAVNWKIPHSLFNVACKYRDASELQEINWHEIYKSRDLGRFSNGNKVMV